VPYIFDPSQQIVRLDEQALTQGLTGAHALFVNEYEFNLLQKHTRLSADEILTQLSFAVITMADAGSRVYQNGVLLSDVPAFPPERILDPTGVGDAFRAGFLKGYVNGLDLVLCAQMGALAATYTLEEIGPQSHCYMMSDFINRFRTRYDDKGALDIFV
jgi:adenosine kinase